MASLQPVRGTHDILPDAMRLQRHIIDSTRKAVQRYGFEEMATPIFEFSDVFARTLGDVSDIVTKEMYSFVDRGGEAVTLRPENTASICRSLISNGLTQELPWKVFYAGPMFRYERPQKGRLRQFHQVGIELLGAPQAQGDIEVIAASAAVLRALGLWERVSLEINSLGDAESRAAYRSALLTFLQDYRQDLSEDSQLRLERNPLRILDSKNERDQRILEKAPIYRHYLNASSEEFFLKVLDGLTALGLRFVVNPRLVRGLDYYTHSCFEISASELGAQKTVLAGGRYDGLVHMMGGPDVAGIGWAAGIERLSLLVASSVAPPKPRPVAIIPIGSQAERQSLVVAETLRNAEFAVDMAYSGNLAKRMKRANKIEAIAALLLGEDELKRNTVTIRDLGSGSQVELPLDRAVAHLKLLCNQQGGDSSEALEKVESISAAR